MATHFLAESFKLGDLRLKLYVCAYIFSPFAWIFMISFVHLISDRSFVLCQVKATNSQGEWILWQGHTRGYTIYVLCANQGQTVRLRSTIVFRGDNWAFARVRVCKNLYNRNLWNVWCVVSLVLMKHRNAGYSDPWRKCQVPGQGTFSLF